MAETHEHVVAKLGKIKGYQQQFKAVFGTDVNLQGIAEAIARLKTQPGQDMSVGGATIAAALMLPGLIDEYQLFV